jgi:hypothetical protein
MSKMSWLAKLGLVIGGYVMACLIAVGAVYINTLFTDPAVLQASSGMSAFGDPYSLRRRIRPPCALPNWSDAVFSGQKIPKPLASTHGWQQWNYTSRRERSCTYIGGSRRESQSVV